MDKHYDTIIIGSGLGGLTTALLLAKEGRSVCVLEKNNQYGGNLQTFSRSKLLFDTGVHYLGGLSKGQNLYQYFSYLGIMDDLEIAQMDMEAYDVISFGDDPTLFPHAQGYDNFVTQLASLFPEEKKNIQKYVQLLKKTCQQFPGYYLNQNIVLDTSLLQLSIKQVLGKITSNKKLQAILCGSNFLYAGGTDTDPFYLHALTVNSYIQSAYKCIKGGSQISKLLVRKLRAHGADIFKHTTVNAMEIDEVHHRVKTIKTKQGHTLTADNFVSNIDIRQVLQWTKGYFRKSFVKRGEAMEPTISCFSVYMILKPGLVPHFNHNHYHFQSENDVWNASEAAPAGWPSFYMLSSTPSLTDPHFAASVTALSYMDYEEVKAWEETMNTVAAFVDRGKDYADFKQAKAELLIEEITKKYPILKEAIVDIHTSTPLSYRDYIGSYRGGMYGYRKDAIHPLATMFSPRTAINNLYLTGQSTNTHGILGVTIGAFHTAAAILGEDFMHQRLAQWLQANDEQRD